MGRLDRILLLAVSSPSNYLVVGFWALLLCGTLAAAMLLVWLGVPSVPLPLFRALAVLLAAVSFVAVIYTGLLLSGMPSVPLWFGPWLPGLFAISALSCGVALWAWWQYFRNGDGFRPNDAASRSRRYILLALEAVVVTLWLGAAWLEHGGSASSGATPTDAAALASVASLLNGACSLPFWGGLVLVGLAAPFAIEAVLARCNARKDVAEASLASRAGLLASAGCVLVGGACLRAVVVAAGMLPVVSSPLVL
ncbi:MAG: NrfD/PsrC family molybdoenzyme membrane anchor subunit [Adlercreutzia sp.]